MPDYQIHDLSERQLKFGYWLLTHARNFKKALIIALIAVSALFWGLAIYGLTVYLVNSQQDQQIIQGIADNDIDFEGFRQRHKPQDLVFGPSQLIYTGNNKYDFSAEAYNPNLNRGIVALSYFFTAGDFTTATESITIWPGQKVLLLSLANQTVRRLTEANLQIDSLVWQPLGQQAIDPSVEPVTVSEIEFTQEASSKQRSYVTFNARNNIFKNYWTVDFQAALYSGNNLIGVNQIRVNEFLAEETRALEMSWFESLPRVSRVEVTPLLNIYDSANFYSLPGQAVEE
ncbi:MAG: hypothetical protein Q8P32_03975 [Candidatus Komeilibacteria bacterium]|nr:hypothetical protein [Candidatus Komeilibacteria bacterium]